MKLIEHLDKNAIDTKIVNQNHYSSFGFISQEYLIALYKLMHKTSTLHACQYAVSDKIRLC